MTELVATSPGLFPLPDWAKSDLSDLKGHQKDDLISGDETDDIVAVYEDAREEVVADQLDAGLDRVVEGQLRWDDMLAHPLTIHDNVETGGIVRYYDNNNFYRDPQVVGDLSFSGDVAAELEAASEFAGETPLQAVLPGPYSLAELATDEYYGDEADFLAAIGDFLGGEVEAFPDHETLFLLDPSLATDAPDDDIAERVPEAIDAVAGATDADVVVHTYWDAIDEKTYAHLMDADIEAIGFDFVAGDRETTLYNINEYGAKDDVALGLADGQNTLVEDPETIRERVEWVNDQIHASEFDTAYVTTNTEPFYLPVNKHQEKLAALAAAADLESEVEA
ncbi:methionine synthase ii (cobalamin-independent) [Halogeometricum borinquense DSM 11551]|uniref:Methionine synthase II (Cobalamin-independent) n=1 Tax=Halogeometricum borinquense (strain ATCC 700274 / DSM 11551 / JCM 10706 / KCTC 4070 / PR3) TaxID=469382 RepID=E4NR64_HALBP|nr:methionine synthase ii (cobalamin-independent) [Halogeometricum borinquense]ADQ66800.1 methionine synthase II (cobalamin-independent) [Halogeometricum borinquense DSM 11551]ELY30308.1 methionine synthase ii (cobalamin-independent) [Halogeometricum borinquense DSM 11551]